MTGDDLRRRRRALGLTQRQLADRLGKAANEIGRWELRPVIAETRAAWLDQKLCEIEAAHQQENRP